MSAWFLVSFYTIDVGKNALGGLEKRRKKQCLLLWCHTTTANGFQHNIVQVGAEDPRALAAICRNSLAGKVSRFKSYICHDCCPIGT